MIFFRFFFHAIVILRFILVFFHDIIIFALQLCLYSCFRPCMNGIKASYVDTCLRRVRFCCVWTSIFLSYLFPACLLPAFFHCFWSNTLFRLFVALIMFSLALLLNKGFDSVFFFNYSLCVLFNFYECFLISLSLLFAYYRVHFFSILSCTSLFDVHRFSCVRVTFVFHAFWILFSFLCVYVCCSHVEDMRLSFYRCGRTLLSGYIIDEAPTSLLA